MAEKVQNPQIADLENLYHLEGMSESEMFNRGLIPFEVSEKIRNRTCFYKNDEYRLTLEGGKLVLHIFENEKKEYYELY